MHSLLSFVQGLFGVFYGGESAVDMPFNSTYKQVIENMKMIQWIIDHAEFTDTWYIGDIPLIFDNLTKFYHENLDDPDPEQVQFADCQLTDLNIVFTPYYIGSSEIIIDERYETRYHHVNLETGEDHVVDFANCKFVTIR